MVDWLGKPLGKQVNFMGPNNKSKGKRSKRNYRNDMFLGSSKKYIPTNMFKDYDRDGVANVFDCKPRNKKEQGFIDAMIGGVKGLFSGTGMKKGWSEGMAKPGNYATRAVQRYKENKRLAKMPVYTEQHIKKIQQKIEDKVPFDITRGAIEAPRSKPKELPFDITRDALESSETIPTRGSELLQEAAQRGAEAKKAYFTSKGYVIPEKESAPVNLQPNEGKYMEINPDSEEINPETMEKLIEKGRILEEAKKGYRKRRIMDYATHPIQTLMQKPDSIIRNIVDTPYMKHLYNKFYMGPQAKSTTHTIEKVNPKTGKITRTIVTVTPPKVNRIERARQVALHGNIRDVDRRRMINLKKSIRYVFPILPRATTTAVYQYQSKKGMQKGRGRPIGSVKYKNPYTGEPIGVFQWRKMMGQQRGEFRQKLRMQQELMRRQRMAQSLPQYETQQYQQQQQLPQELQGQGITPEYSQAPEQMPQQVQYQQQQAPQPFQYVTEEKRPIGRVFKSYGGSPYKPVSNQPLAPSRQTIPYGYIESVDLMTSKRFIKALPKKEKWT